MKYLLRIIEFVLPIISIVLIVSQVIVSNELATLGKRLGQLESDVRIESDMKEDLEIRVASASSLLTLRDRAIAIGFVEPTSKQILNLLREVPVALETVQNSVLRP